MSQAVFFYEVKPDYFYVRAAGSTDTEKADVRKRRLRIWAQKSLKDILSGQEN